MNNFPDNVISLEEVADDFRKLDNSQRISVLKAIRKTATNPQEKPAGYGTPLSGNLAGFCKIKLLKYGIRVVYRYQRSINGMLLIVIAMRKDDEVNITVRRSRQAGAG